MPAENLYLALYDPETQLISFPYHVDEVTPRPAPCPLGTGLTGYVFRLGKPLLVDEAMNARKRKENNTVTFEGYEGIRYVESGIAAAIWLGVPLSTGGKPFGVLAVQDYHNPEAYGETEKQLLTFVAVQVALAIERKRVQQALRDSEVKFRALFLASSQGVILHDQNSYLEINPAAVRMLGYQSAEELLGKGPKDTSPPFQPGGEASDVLAAKYIAECVRKGHARFDWVSRTAKGDDLPLEVILTRIDWGGRQIIQAVMNDITARKNAERKLLDALAREKELGQLRSDFVSMVSHEFRTPL
jgi:PAS domain S-box-containing protein